MAPIDPPPRRRWFSLVSRSRRHTTWRAAGDAPGLLMFAMIGLLGAVALAAAALHYQPLHVLVHADRVLGGVGAFLLVLALWQGIALARR